MSRSNAVGKLSEIVQAVQAGGDSKDVLFEQLGDISKVRVLHGQVLVATHAGTMYHPGTKILRTDKSLQETQFQGSIGLVVRVGPSAFVDAPKIGIEHRDKAEVGDWVLYRPSDGLQLYIREVPCRLFDDSNIKMVVGDPEIFW